MRILLLLCLLGMQILAAFYLQTRRMTLMEYLGWGLLTVIVPALGPFLVILSAPGQPKVRHGRSMRWHTPRWVQQLSNRLVRYIRLYS
jgi:hypothetical protein